MQVLAKQNLNPQRISQYLRAILRTEDTSVCQQMIKYIIVVRAKYLQMSCAYYIYKKDTKRVAAEFDSFNQDYEKFIETFTTETGLIFQPEEAPSIELLNKCQNATKVESDLIQSTKIQPSPSQDPVEKGEQNS